jgi:predicted aspartyl protease
VPSWSIPSSELARLGPIIDIHVGIGTAQEAALRIAGDPVPPPVPIAALIDTGASHTVLQQGMAAQIGAQPIGSSTFHTASHANVLCARYKVQLYFPHTVVLEATVVEMPLQGQPIQCLIGRDILAQAVLVYLGESNLFSISF